MIEVSGAACFGKLPFHREYLRLGLDGTGVGAIVRWVDEAHESLSRGRSGQPLVEAWVRFAVRHEGGAVVGGIRPSTDGLRRHPIAVCAWVASVADAHWCFVPEASGPLWTELERIVDGARTVDELAIGLASVRLAIDPSGPAERGETAGAISWADLVGGDTEDALHAATNLAAVVEVQRTAASAAEGVAVIVPLARPPAAAIPSSAVWIRLVTTAAGAEDAAPTLLVLPEPPRLVVSFRPLDGDDIAAALTGRAAETMDDLLERWQKVPHGDESRRVEADHLMARVPDVWSSLGIKGST